MKRLSQSTLRKYSVSQLTAHLNRVMDAHWAGQQPYRIDTAYGWIRVREDGGYLCYCPLTRADLIDLIDEVWRSIERR